MAAPVSLYAGFRENGVPDEERIPMIDKAKNQTAGAGASRGTPGGKSPEAEAGPVGPLAFGRRRSVAREREVVLLLLRGVTLEALSRELQAEPNGLTQWREKATIGIEATLRVARQRVADHTMESEGPWQGVRERGPLRGMLLAREGHAWRAVA